MITFILGITALILGYIFYGKFIEKSFGIEHKRTTPAFELADGNDYVVMGTKKNALICRKAFYTDKKEAKKGNVIQQT